jgi:hypothetical protein
MQARAQRVLSGKKAESEVAINQQALKADRRLDGKSMLTTKTSLSLAEVAKTYQAIEKPCKPECAIVRAAGQLSMGK